ncbi:MAG: hypothetical protein WDO19_05685 [Bacteroidota bacterium]
MNEPSAVVLESNSSSSATGQVGESKIYLEQNPLLPYQWEGTYWPVESGWQSLIQFNGQVQNWYAYNKMTGKHWAIFRNWMQQKNMQQFTLLYLYNSPQGKMKNGRLI